MMENALEIWWARIFKDVVEYLGEQLVDPFVASLKKAMSIVHGNRKNAATSEHDPIEVIIRTCLYLITALVTK
ncbi:hypothetical protein PM082_000235 [Marasmius tenuissimus]|nr:hypothetical protein PM082_000235 [Marasmius tenuissimus]